MCRAQVLYPGLALTVPTEVSSAIASVDLLFRGCSKRPFSKAAASEEARRTLRYVESLSDARTTLADFFSILLNRTTNDGAAL